MRRTLVMTGLMTSTLAVAAPFENVPWEEAVTSPGHVVVSMAKEGTCTGAADGWSSEVVAAWLGGHPEVMPVSAPRTVPVVERLIGDGYLGAVMNLAYKDGVEVDRICGCMDGPSLTGWLVGVVDGRTRADALRAELDRSKVDPWPLGRWLELVQMHDCANRLIDAFEVAKVIWDTVPDKAPHLRVERLTRVAHDMGVLARKSPEVRDQIAALRDTYTEAKDTNRAALDDWLALNRILLEDDVTVAWYEAKKSDPAVQPLIQQVAPNVFYLLAERGRWPEAGALIDDPSAWLALWKQQTGGLDTASWGYAALLAAGRVGEAGKLAKDILKVQPTGACKMLSKSVEVGATHKSQASVAKQCDDAAVVEAWNAAL